MPLPPAWLGIECQVHGYPIATQRKEDPLPKAQQARITPDQIDGQCRDGKREITTKQVEAKIVKNCWQYEQGKSQQNPGKKSTEELQGEASCGWEMEWQLEVNGGARSGIHRAALLGEHSIGTELEKMMIKIKTETRDILVVAKNSTTPLTASGRSGKTVNREPDPTTD